ncbi:hypothetical protein [Mesorhizobium sp.]|uniref:hypothetical protein n=2 Tax=Mesorhizobium sp. TaxID=1871066 RepID=UPI000FE439C9|nr:hypothetical protein [Mesorhizobium sp.]RWI35539.1 MAG: hypothetical protein EOR14_28980 [Mesorhizobium sp.]RWJ03475.1 MAG: hypothetical protein EOR24_32360 [Mesorhizobium sp.]
MTTEQRTPKEFFKVASAARDFVEDWKKENLRLCIVGTTHATLLDDALKDLSRAHEEALVAAPSPATEAVPDDADREFDLDAFHREVWGWLLKRGLVDNGDSEWDGFTAVIEEHEQEIEAAASRAAASTLTALQAENERLKAELAQLRSDQVRWTNAVVVSAPGLYPQDYMISPPCAEPKPKPDVLHIDGAVYRRQE